MSPVALMYSFYVRARLRRIMYRSVCAGLCAGAFSPEEARAALAMISEEFEPIPSDWKLRYQMNLDLLKKGSVMDIAAIVRALYHRSKVKELPILERKLYDSALRLLVDEVSFSLKKNKDDVETLIFNRLENKV